MRKDRDTWLFIISLVWLAAVLAGIAAFIVYLRW